MSRQVYAPATSPVYIAANHCKTPGVKVVWEYSDSRTYRVADVGGRNNTGVKEDSKELDNRIEVEEHQDFLAT